MATATIAIGWAKFISLMAWSLVRIFPTIPSEWIIAQREGVKNGSVRGPRVWASANIIDGPPPEGTGMLRRQRTSIIVDSEDEARKAVRGLVEKGVDGIKLFERLKPQVAKAAADEAHKLGRPVFGHSLDIFTAAANGYKSVEHSWSVVYTSIQDPKKRHDLDIGAHAAQSRYGGNSRAHGAGDIR